MCAIAVMLIFGIIGLSGREFKIVGQRKVRGSTARVLGGILVVGAVLGLLSNLFLAADSTGTGAGAMLGGLSSLICIGSFLFVIVLGLVLAKTDEQTAAQNGTPPV